MPKKSCNIFYKYPLDKEQKKWYNYKVPIMST